MQNNVNQGAVSTANQSIQDCGIDASSTKCSVRGHGRVAGYAVNTHQGIVRGYNEDRVSIVLNIMKPPNRSEDEEWPKCSFFGVYDGHGGSGCADFLRDQLH